MLFRFHNIGRDNFNGVVDLPSENDLLPEISKHLLSRGISVEEIENEKGEGTGLYNVYAGFHCVGQVEKL